MSAKDFATEVVLARLKSWGDSLDVPYEVFEVAGIPVDSKEHVDWLTEHGLRMKKLRDRYLRLVLQ